MLKFKILSHIIDDSGLALGVNIGTTYMLEDKFELEAGYSYWMSEFRKANIFYVGINYLFN